MAVMYPTKEEYEILRNFLSNGIIIAPEVAETLTDEEKEALEAAADNYDFGGDADCWIDVVTTRKHCFIKTAME